MYVIRYKITHAVHTVRLSLIQQHYFFTQLSLVTPDFKTVNNSKCGRDSSVGIATRYGLDGPGIKSRLWGGEIFRIRPDRPWGPLSLLYNEYRVFPGGKAAGAWC